MPILRLPPRGQPKHTKHNPFFSLLKTSLLPKLDDFLAAGNRKIQMWHDAINKADVIFEAESAFRNINTMEELRQASTPV